MRGPPLFRALELRPLGHILRRHHISPSHTLIWVISWGAKGVVLWRGAVMRKTGELFNWSFTAIKVPTQWVAMVMSAGLRGFWGANICIFIYLFFPAWWMFVVCKLFGSVMQSNILYYFIWKDVSPCISLFKSWQQIQQSTNQRCLYWDNLSAQNSEVLFKHCSTEAAAYWARQFGVQKLHVIHRWALKDSHTQPDVVISCTRMSECCIFIISQHEHGVSRCCCEGGCLSLSHCLNVSLYLWCSSCFFPWKRFLFVQQEKCLNHPREKNPSENMQQCIKWTKWYLMYYILFLLLYYILFYITLDYT